MRTLVLAALIAIAGCAGGAAEPAKAPSTSSCDRCGKNEYCELLGSSGPEGAPAATSTQCRPLPESCRRASSCGCFTKLKGCRCQRTTAGFEVSCPAP